MREIITNNEGFSRAFVIPIQEYTHEYLSQLAKYYYQLRKLYKDERALGDKSHGWKLGIYKEIKDLEYFFVLLGHDITVRPYPVDFSHYLTKTPNNQ